MKDYKTLAETIYKRKAVREFSKNPVEILENGVDLMETFDIQSLVNTIKVKIKVLKKGEVKNNRSDYCIAFYSEEKPLSLENVGFIGQQLELELQSKGIGTCWWGMKKPSKDYKIMDGLDCVITMTAGYPLKKEIRNYPNGFKRKQANEIVIGNTTPDRFIEAARIAPSAVNLQPWLIEKTGTKYNFYLRPVKSIMEKMVAYMRHIDMGIAMAHVFIQAKTDGLGVSFGFEGTDIAQGKFVASIAVQ